MLPMAFPAHCNGVCVCWGEQVILTTTAEYLSVRQLIVRCSQVVLVYMYMYVPANIGHTSSVWVAIIYSAEMALQK